MRRVIGCLIVAFLFSFLFAQQANAEQETSVSDSEMTVEDAYLQSYTNMVVKELIDADGRDNKMVALQYIKEAVDNGNSSLEIVSALDTLSMEGISNISRENGRIANNYPDVRREACAILGKIHTEESKNTLIQVLYTDNEPSVISAAVKSLGEIGINNADETTEMIAWIARKFDIVNPTSSLALEILDAFEKLAPTVQQPAAMVQMIIQISTNYQYVTPVRNRARAVLKSISTKSNQKEAAQQ